MKIGDLVKLTCGPNLGKCGIIINVRSAHRQTTLDIAITDGNVLRRIWKKHIEVISEI